MPAPSVRRLVRSTTALRALTPSSGPVDPTTQAGTTADQVVLSSFPTVAERSGFAAGLPAPSLNRSLASAGDRARTGRVPSGSMVNVLPRTQVRSRSSVITSIGGDPISHVIYLPTQVGKFPASPTCSPTVSPQMRLTNIRNEGNPAMPQTLHPLEKWILNRPSIRRRLLAIFLEDNNLSESERSFLEDLGSDDREVIDYRSREVAADSFKRNGDSRLTRDRFHDVGLQLIVLDPPPSDKIVNFPTHVSAG